MLTGKPFMRRTGKETIGCRFGLPGATEYSVNTALTSVGSTSSPAALAKDAAKAGPSGDAFQAVLNLSLGQAADPGGAPLPDPGKSSSVKQAAPPMPSRQEKKNNAAPEKAAEPDSGLTTLPVPITVPVQMPVESAAGNAAQIQLGGDAIGAAAPKPQPPPSCADTPETGRTQPLAPSAPATNPPIHTETTAVQVAGVFSLSEIALPASSFSPSEVVQTAKSSSRKPEASSPANAAPQFMPGSADAAATGTLATPIQGHQAVAALEALAAPAVAAPAGGNSASFSAPSTTAAPLAPSGTPSVTLGPLAPSSPPLGSNAVPTGPKDTPVSAALPSASAISQAGTAKPVAATVQLDSAAKRVKAGPIFGAPGVQHGTKTEAARQADAGESARRANGGGTGMGAAATQGDGAAIKEAAASGQGTAAGPGSVAFVATAAHSNGSEQPSAFVREQETQVGSGLHSSALLGEQVPAHLPGPVNTARMLQTMSGTEMRVGVHSPEFGSISIATSVSPGGLQAQIALDHNALGKELALHLPGVEEKLGSALGMTAHVEVRNGGGGAAAQDGTGGFGGREASAGSGRQSRGSGDAQAGAPQRWKNGPDTAIAAAEKARSGAAVGARLSVHV